jgi:hypothetical protein
VVDLLGVKIGAVWWMPSLTGLGRPVCPSGRREGEGYRSSVPWEKVTVDRINDLASQNDTQTLRALTQSLEISPGSVQPLEDLAEAFNVRRRVLYDFVRICTAFHIFRHGANNYLEWRSPARVRGAINRFRVEVDAEDDNPKTLKQFHSSLNPPLQLNGGSILIRCGQTNADGIAFRFTDCILQDRICIYMEWLDSNHESLFL